MEEGVTWNHSTSHHFSDNPSRLQDNNLAHDSGALMAATDGPYYHSLPTSSGFSIACNAQSSPPDNLLGYGTTWPSASCSSADDSFHEFTSPTRLGRTAEHHGTVIRHGPVADDTPMRHVIYDNSQERRHSTSINFPPKISSPAAAPDDPRPLPKQASDLQKQERQTKYQCWNECCKGRSFSSSANLRRHLREQEGWGRKWICFYCMKEFSRSSACRHHIEQKVCFKPDSSSKQPLQAKVLY